MSESRRRAPRGQGATLRGEVLAAAMDVLRETGSEEAMSLRVVAQRVGVSVPSIYLHFSDKQALLDAVCGEVFEQLHVALRQASAASGDPLQALRNQGVAYLRFALANPEHYRLVMMTNPSSDDPSEEIASGAFGHLLDGVRACLQVGVLDGDPVELALLLWAGTHGLASLMIAKPLFPWPDPDVFFDRMVTSLGMGLAASSRLPDCLPADEVVRRLERLR